MKKNVQDLHKEYNKFQDILRLQLVHVYNKKIKQWEFNGYRCRHCDTLLQYASSITKHPDTCRVLNKVYKIKREEPLAIMTTDHKIWEPITDKLKKDSS